MPACDRLPRGASSGPGGQPAPSCSSTARLAPVLPPADGQPGGVQAVAHGAELHARPAGVHTAVAGATMQRSRRARPHAARSCGHAATRTCATPRFCGRCNPSRLRPTGSCWQASQQVLWASQHALWACKSTADRPANPCGCVLPCRAATELWAWSCRPPASLRCHTRRVLA